MVVVFVRLLRDEEVVVATVVFRFLDFRLVVASAIWTVVITVVLASGCGVGVSVTSGSVPDVLGVSVELERSNCSTETMPDVLGVSVELERSNCSIETVLSTISVVT